MRSCGYSSVLSCDLCSRSSLLNVTADRRYVADRPPSTARVTPWTKLASSLARKTIAAASSSGSATLPAGASDASWFTISAGTASIMRVRVGPGETALTRTPLGPYSAAQAFVKSSRAARLAPYIAIPACPKLATIVEALTIEPHPRPAMAGARDRDEEER